MGSNGLFLFILLSLPLLFIGVVFVFFPQKVIRIRARFEQNIFHFFNYEEKDIDKLSVYSTLFGEGYSKRLKDQQERPREFKLLIIWTRIIGFIVLLMTFIAYWIFILAVRSGNLIIR